MPENVVRVDAKVNKNVNTPNVMLTRQTAAVPELEYDYRCRQTQCTPAGIELLAADRGAKGAGGMLQVVRVFSMFAIKFTAIFIVNSKIVYDNRTSWVLACQLGFNKALPLAIAVVVVVVLSTYEYIPWNVVQL